MPDEFKPEVVKAWKKEVREAKKDVAAISDQTAILNNLTQDLSKSQIKQNKNLAITLDASKKAARAGKMSLEQLKRRSDLIGDIAKGAMDLNSIKQKERDIEEEIIKIQRRYKGGNKEKGDQLIRELKADKDILGTEKERIFAQERANKLTGAADDLTGGLVSKYQQIKEDVKGLPLGTKLFVVGLMAATKILKDFSENLDKIGEEFGAIGVREMSGQLMAADVEMAKLGYDAGSAAEVTKELADNFGIGLGDAIGMSAAVGDMSKALGVSLAEGSKLVGMFSEMGGMTPAQAEDMTKMTAQLAKSNKVNPSAVLKDIAANTEVFAKYSQDGGANIAKGAIMAKKLGTNLSDVASTMEGMLNFADSTTKAMEASVMVGRDINIQKLQEASLAGDMETVMAEQARLLGDQEKWNSMNVLQRKALAEALGLSVEQAAKMVGKEKESISLAGELSKQPGFEELVGEEALSALSDMLFSLKSIGAAFTKIFGPALNAILVPLGFVVEVIGSFVSLIDRTIGVMPILIGLITAWGVANAKAGYKAAIASGQAMLAAITKIWQAMSAMSLASLGFGTPVALAMGAGAVATIIASVMAAKSKKVGDAFASPGKPTMTTAQGETFEGSVRDDILMAPNIAGAQAATATAGADGTAAIVGAITKLTDTTQVGIDKQPDAKAIGKATGKSIEQLGDG